MELPNTITQIFTLSIFLFFQLFPMVLTFPHVPSRHHHQIPGLLQQSQPSVPLQPRLSPETELSSEQQEFLDVHNKARAHVGHTLFVWDETLAAFARSWANERKSDCRMIHSSGPYGENIFWGGRDHWTAGDAVRAWVREHRFYDRRTNYCLPEKLCGHYTQIVWRDSTKLGCARVKCKTGGVFIICNYDPPGNYVNENPFHPLQPDRNNDDDDDDRSNKQP